MGSVQYGGLEVTSLFFADDVLLAPSDQEHRHALEHFAAEFVADGMKIITSKPEALVLSEKRVGCSLQV